MRSPTENEKGPPGGPGGWMEGALLAARCPTGLAEADPRAQPEDAVAPHLDHVRIHLLTLQDLFEESPVYRAAVGDMPPLAGLVAMSCPLP